jgi:small subunit ribosomal protein S5
MSVNASANPNAGSNANEGGELQTSDGFKEKLVSVGRVTKVVKGGRIFSFSVVVIVGDGNGRVGIGKGKAREVPNAIKKAMEDARRRLIRIELNGTTLFHPIKVKHGATKIVMLPASQGTGIIAGGAMRAIFEVLGVQNVFGKVYGSTNPINVVKATIEGLVGMVSPEAIAQKRGKTVAEIFGASA